MARFILDVGNLDPVRIQKLMRNLCDDTNEIISITCIDETNTNQFYTETRKNRLTEDQIKNYNESLENPNKGLSLHSN